MARSVLFVLFLIAMSVNAAPDAKYECLRKALSIADYQDQARAAYDASNMLALHDHLGSSIQDALKACNLNLDSATKRCEQQNKVGACENIHAAAVQVKCDSRFKRVGCCHCAMLCPSSAWMEDEYHCTKPASSESQVYVNEISCPGTCEEIAGRFVPVCTEGLKRVSLNKCVAVCPLGWHDEGARCRKPANYRLTQPFFWAIGDN